MCSRAASLYEDVARYAYLRSAPLRLGGRSRDGLMDRRHDAADPKCWAFSTSSARREPEPRRGRRWLAALAVAAPGFMLAGRRAQPWLASQYFWPVESAIDPSLVADAALFGIRRGLVGLCPGPALERLATLSPGVIVFVAAIGRGHGASRAPAPKDTLVAERRTPACERDRSARARYLATEQIRRR